MNAVSSSASQEFLEGAVNLLEDIFIYRRHAVEILPKDIVVRLLLAKKLAVENGYNQFDQVLLRIGKICDERSAKEDNASHRSLFFLVVDYFHLFDDTVNVFNRLAFMDNLTLTEDTVIEQARIKKMFDQLDEALFAKLFVDDLVKNSFIGSYGQKKVKVVFTGLDGISAGIMSAALLISDLRKVEEEEKQLTFMLDALRGNLHNNYAHYAGKHDLDTLKTLVTIEMRHKTSFDGEIADDLFKKGVAVVKKEAIYLNNLLPVILREKNRNLRKQFLKESELDLFHIEELEHHFCDNNGIPRSRLSHVR